MTDRLSPQREAEIRERVEAATPGPWGSHRDLNGSYTVQARPRTTRYGMENDGNVAAISACRGDSDAYGNARFIGHSREDVPELLAEVAAVRAERDEARATLREACEQVAEQDDEIGKLSVEVSELRRSVVEFAVCYPDGKTVMTETVTTDPSLAGARLRAHRELSPMWRDCRVVHRIGGGEWAETTS